MPQFLDVLSQTHQTDNSVVSLFESLNIYAYILCHLSDFISELFLHKFLSIIHTACHISSSDDWYIQFV